MTTAQPEPAFVFCAVPEDAGCRLDAFLTRRIPSVSRSRLADMIRRGLITVDRRNRKPGYRIRPGERITGYVLPPLPISCKPEPIPLDILYEDAELAVICKPAGMVVHPAPGHESGTLVNALLYHMPDIGNIGGELRPGIVHRLDKDTSGLLLVAKTDASLASLADQFRLRTVKKQYAALVHGIPAAGRGEIDLPVGRHGTDRKRMTIHAPNARSALTRWRIIRRFHSCALLEIDLLTGRTHQIRVHCKAIGHPVVGDQTYGKNPRPHLQGTNDVHGKIRAGERRILKTAQRQLLHAARLRFTHPNTGATVEISAPLPADFQNIFDQLSSPPREDAAEIFA